MTKMASNEARMRKALEQIADPLTLELPGFVGTELALKIIIKVQSIARDALKESDQEFDGAR